MTGKRDQAGIYYRTMMNGVTAMTKLRCFSLAVAIGIFAAGTTWAQKGEIAGQRALKEDLLIQSFFAKHTGDLPEMLERNTIRVLVVPNYSTYFLDDKGQPRGLDYELLKGWEKMLNKGREKGASPIKVKFIPVTVKELGAALLEGRGDIAGITLVTPDRAEEFAYATPIIDSIQEVVVTRKGGPAMTRLEDLAGQEVHVVAGSAQVDSLSKLNQQFKKQGLPPMKMILAAHYVAPENLLEMLHAGMIQAAVISDAFARLWNRVFPNLVVHENIPVTSGLKAAWAVRKNNPQLLAKLNEAIASVLTEDRKTFNREFNQYFKTTHWIENPFSKSTKFALAAHFQKEAAAFGMNWHRLMAQGFQESALNPDAKSPTGAVGIMQVLPSTAEWLGVPNYEEVEGNIHAGAKYMDNLMKRWAREPGITADNRFYFALAAYNAGPGRVGTYRKQAQALGYNPDVWFGSVERIPLHRGNLETVMYVRNILNYAMAYQSAYDRALQREKMSRTER